MKKVLLVILGLMLVIACGKKEETGTQPIKIGLTQIVEHPSLDQIKQGIIDRLAEKGYKDGEKIIINFQSAQGEMTSADLIAKNFAEKEDIIIAITTPSAQAALNATKNKPIFFSAVTDPIVAGLEGNNITGTSDATPIEAQMLLAKELLGNFKKVGVVYNIGEANSEAQVKQIKELGAKEGFQVIAKGINTINDISTALDVIIDEIDFLYTPVDNMLASSYPVIVKKFSEKNKPIIGSVTDYVNQGALATEGINQYKIGIQTADMIIRYLEGKEKIADMPFETVKETDLLINETVATKLGIKINEELAKRAKFTK